MIIANLTPDDVPWMHIGVTGVLKAGDMAEFEDGRGRHILSKWGQRGILRMGFEDNSEEGLVKKTKEAKGLYDKFWMRQISYHNQHNDALKNAGGAYVTPSEELEVHAAMLGVDVIGPWNAAKAKENADLAKLKEENKTLVDSLKDMQVQISALGNKGAVEDNYETYRKQFKPLNREKLLGFVNDNAATILTWPMAIFIELKEKFLKFYDEEDWPLPT